MCKMINSKSFHKLSAWVLALIMMVGATQAWAYDTDIAISTSNIEGWSINNNSIFHVNTWSVEGNTDGSGMTTPFLENWINRNDGKLPAATWSYTLTNLVPNATYTVSALVRAINENNSAFQGSVNLYAGSSQSNNISNGIPIKNGNTTIGYFATLTVEATSDASGKLTLGLKTTKDACNWVAMKDVKASLIAPFTMISTSAEITDGDEYLLVYKSSDAVRTGYVLDGNEPRNKFSAKSVTINQNEIASSRLSSFVINRNGSLYDVKEVGGGQNFYLLDEGPYSTTESGITIQEWYNGGFVIYRVIEWSQYTNWHTNYLDFRTNTTNFYIKNNYPSNRTFLYKKVKVSFPESSYTAKLSEGFDAPQAITTPSGLSVSYSSSDPSVATVNAKTGAVTLQKGGTVTISAIYTGPSGGKAVASYQLTVIAKSSANLTAWLADAANNPVADNTVTYGETGYKVGHNKSGNGEVSFSSSNTSVAEVDAKTGAITIRKAGETVITIRCAETSTYLDGEVSLTLKVNRKAATLSASPTNQTIKENNPTGAIVTATYDGDGEVKFRLEATELATLTYVGNVATVLPTRKGEGTVKVYYSATAGTNYLAAEGGYVTVSISKLPAPVFSVNPASLNLYRNQSAEIEVVVSAYDGTYSLNSVERRLSINATSGTGTQRFSITAVDAGQDQIVVHFPETENYSSASLSVPVTISNSYLYSLALVNAPQRGVAVTINGTKYTSAQSRLILPFQLTTANINDYVKVSPHGTFRSEVTLVDDVITVTYSVKMPEQGTFIRLRSFANGNYLTLSSDGAPLIMKAVADASNIIYYDENGRFLFYQNGQYVKNVCQQAAVGTSDSDLSTFRFEIGSGDYENYFMARSNTSACLRSGSTAMSGVGGNEDSYWLVERVESLPLSFSPVGNGYSTVYAPVALQVPSGVTAYYVNRKEGTGEGAGIEAKLYLSKVTDPELEPNQPAILIGMAGATYYFDIDYQHPSSGAVWGNTNLIGTLPTLLTSAKSNEGVVYTLQPNSNGGVGFYQWVSGHTSTLHGITYSQDYITGFKCYFVESGSSQAAGYRFEFNEELGETTNMETLISADEVAAPVYNLQGKRVASHPDNLPAGLYLVQGKKILRR